MQSFHPGFSYSVVASGFQESTGGFQDSEIQRVSLLPCSLGNTIRLQYNSCTNYTTVSIELVTALTLDASHKFGGPQAVHTCDQLVVNLGFPIYHSGSVIY